MVIISDGYCNKGNVQTNHALSYLEQFHSKSICANTRSLFFQFTNAVEHILLIAQWFQSDEIWNK